MSLRKLNIDSLLELCKQGNAQAQMEVYDRYYNAMYNTAVRIVKDSMEAEDIMQESFLSAFTKLDSFRGEVAFGAWLKRIVINNSIQAYRRHNGASELALEDVMYKVKDEGEELQGSHDFTELKAQKVLQVMNDLSDNYRLALTLHLIEGHSYEEMSEIMNISYANCRTTVSRAKESLRQKLMVS